MAVGTGAPSEPFRLSMLIYDRRYRSNTIQIVVLIGVLFFFGWLLNNIIQNLEAKEQDFDFSFLWAPAGYRIDPLPIEYNTVTSTHFRAALVGLINTLLVALFGCILATILGVFIGVLRLSKNWLVSRLMAVYVDSLRNVPLVLWILALYAILTNATPALKNFRGENPTASALLDGSLIFTNRGTYFAFPTMSWQLGLLAAILAVSIACALFVRRRSVAKLESEGAEPVSGWTIFMIAVLPAVLTLMIGSGGSFLLTAVIRLLAFAAVVMATIFGLRAVANIINLPATLTKVIVALGALVVVLAWVFKFAPIVMGSIFETLGLDADFVSFVPLDTPELRGFNFQGGFQVENTFVALTVALAIYTSAFIAENVRSGIMAISKGQTEAAYALGLRPGRTMNLVILPQALRVIIPPVISQWLNLTKNTSLAVAISYYDLRSTLGGTTLTQTSRALECMLLMMAIYLTLSLTISSIANLYNRSIQLRAR